MFVISSGTHQHGTDARPYGEIASAVGIASRRPFCRSGRLIRKGFPAGVSFLCRVGDARTRFAVAADVEVVASGGFARQSDFRQHAVRSRSFVNTRLSYSSVAVCSLHVIFSSVFWYR